MDQSYSLGHENKQPLQTLAVAHQTNLSDRKDPIKFLIDYLLFTLDENSSYKANCAETEQQSLTKLQFIEKCTACKTFNKCVINGVYARLS
jgi:hypothetical protein